MPVSKNFVDHTNFFSQPLSSFPLFGSGTKNSITGYAPNNFTKNEVFLMRELQLSPTEIMLMRSMNYGLEDIDKVTRGRMLHGDTR